MRANGQPKWKKKTQTMSSLTEVSAHETKIYEKK
jgi:hypothetical protein